MANGFASMSHTSFSQTRSSLWRLCRATRWKMSGRRGWPRRRPGSPAPMAMTSRIIPTPCCAKHRRANERRGRNPRPAAAGGRSTKTATGNPLENSSAVWRFSRLRCQQPVAPASARPGRIDFADGQGFRGQRAANGFADSSRICRDLHRAANHRKRRRNILGTAPPPVKTVGGIFGYNQKTRMKLSASFPRALLFHRLRGRGFWDKG
jgi:hypothetical protein